MTISLQVAWLFLLAIPIACAAWTVTHEEVFREPREYCLNRYEKGKTLLERNSFIFLPEQTCCHPIYCIKIERLYFGRVL